MNAEPLDSYVQFKGWDTSDHVRDAEWEALFRLVPPSTTRVVLDIGFGTASLLDWAAGLGHRTYGTELIEGLKQAAVARGHVVVKGDLSDAPRCGLITAIDVLEHLDLDTLRAVLASVHDQLSDDGYFLARFPNGQSPFSAIWQHGDITHVRYLTPESLRQVAEPVGLEVVTVANPRHWPKGIGKLKAAMAYAARDMIETALGMIYYGRRVAMDGNVAVVLRRRR